MEVIDFYKSLLNATGCIVDEADNIHRRWFGEFTPITIGGKRLVLPTRNILSEGAWENRVAFHPVCESPTRAESAVFKELRAMMTLRSGQVIMDLLMQLMNIAINKDTHPTLTPDQAEMLRGMPNDIKDATLETLGAVLKACGPKAEHKLINIFIKRGGKLDGQEFRRVAMVDFPILEAHNDDELRIFGVSTKNKRDKQAILKLFEWMLPGANARQYCAGSQDLSAPGFIALCQAFGLVMARLNYVIEVFRDKLEDADELVTTMAWIDGLGSVEQYRIAIPTLSGNDGDPIPVNPASGVAVPQATTQVPPLQVTQQANPTATWNQPAAAPSAVETAPAQTGGISMAHKPKGFADFIAPVNETKPKAPNSNVARTQQTGVVYSEPPPVRAPMVFAQPNVGLYPQQQMPVAYPPNSGYFPAPAAAPAMAVPQLAPIPQHMLAQFPVGPGLAVAVDMASQQPVVVNPQNNQILGTYQQYQQQMMQQQQQMLMQQQQQFVQQPAMFNAPVAYPQPNMTGRQMGQMQLQQADQMRALQQNQMAFQQPIFNGRGY